MELYLAECHPWLVHWVNPSTFKNNIAMLADTTVPPPVCSVSNGNDIHNKECAPAERAAVHI